MTHEKPKKPRRGQAASKDNVLITQTKPLPYLGLTQVCSLIRTEFRPLWLSTHRLPLFGLEGYFKVFFPVLRGSLRLSKDIQKRIKSYSSDAGTLRIWIRMNCLRRADILSLLKFRLRFPAYTITFDPGHPGIQSQTLSSLNALMNNANATWVKHLQQNRITQVRLVFDYYPYQTFNLVMRIVVKEMYAPSWMTGSYARRPLDIEEYKRQLGLDNPVWHVSFGVSYS